MSIRITGKQVEAATKAREKARKVDIEYDDGFGEMPEVDMFEDSEAEAEEKALKDDPEYRRLKEEQRELKRLLRTTDDKNDPRIERLKLSIERLKLSRK